MTTADARRSCPTGTVQLYDAAKAVRAPESIQDTVHVHVRTCSESDKSNAALKQFSATREACRKFTSLFPSLWASAKEQRRVARQQVVSASGQTESLRHCSIDSASSTVGVLETPQIISSGETVRPCQQSYGATTGADPGFKTPPGQGRIRYQYRKRPKELRTIGGPLRDGDPTRDFTLLEEDDTQVSPVHSAVANLLDCLQTHTVESWESMLPHCKATPEISSTSALFYGKCAPPISVEEYILRIQKYSHCTPACFLHAVVYMDRLVDKYGVIFAPNTLNVHRLLLAGTVIAAKFLDDRVFSNAYYARIGGVSTQELNSMEREFLKLMQYRLRVKPALVESYCKALHSAMGRYPQEGGVRITNSRHGEDVASDTTM